jgi:hypothetical protein
MNRFVLVIALSVLSAASVRAQLTAEQRAADLNQLASLYSKNYAPFEWKRDVFHVNLLEVVKASRVMAGPDQRNSRRWAERFAIRNAHASAGHRKRREASSAFRVVHSASGYLRRLNSAARYNPTL